MIIGAKAHAFGAQKSLKCLPTTTTETIRTGDVDQLGFHVGLHTIVNGKEVINFVSANYLGLIGHKKLGRRDPIPYSYGLSPC